MLKIARLLLLADLLCHVAELFPLFPFCSHQRRVFLSLDGDQLALELTVALQPDLRERPFLYRPFDCALCYLLCNGIPGGVEIGKESSL
jgi:hypothetical protein